MNKLGAMEALLRQMPPEQAWAAARESLLHKEDGFALHQQAFALCQAAAPDDAPLPVWHPSESTITNANVTAAARLAGCPDYPAFSRWSVGQRAHYWDLASKQLGIVFRTPYNQVLKMNGPTQPVWFPGAQMNIVDSCFGAAPDMNAIVSDGGDGTIHTLTYAELQARVGRIAASLLREGVGPGDAVAVCLPMTPNAVAIYLAIVSVGAAVVSIAESFAPAEIAVRLRVSSASLVFTQATLRRGGKTLPLYEKIVAADAPRAILLPTPEDALPRRAQDRNWADFLCEEEHCAPVARGPQDAINILFSSGTTGEPKAIPWDHTTPIKCAADAHFHQDIHPGDVLCWPTSLGWMMGPWLVFAALLNRATIALYSDAPMGAGFGRFVQEAHVTMLGVVPSLVRAWRTSGCMEAWDWSAVCAFSSTGECSNASDMLYLMFLANYKPVIEYCGGTEIGGAYCTGTVVQPCVPATFTTPALGTEFAMFDEEHHPHTPGEVFLRGPSVGLSTRLLHRDHDALYFDNTPPSNTEYPWRRHGDEMEALPGGRYRMLGRCDDTMNLGGIKVSSVEIEQVLNQEPGVLETAAIAISPPGGGASRLVVFAALHQSTHISADALLPAFQQAIRCKLNPLFQVADVRLVSSLPRTASNKILRRALRDEYAESQTPSSTPLFTLRARAARRLAHSTAALRKPRRRVLARKQCAAPSNVAAWTPTLCRAFCSAMSFLQGWGRTRRGRHQFRPEFRFRRVRSRSTKSAALG